ncbi:MAG: rane-flanked domain, partial [Marmoricola sp.]|nr:rane-flanked domain [Marmoricola sp.]
MLLVHPVTELVRFLPLVIGVFVLGSGGDNGPWHWLGLALPIAIGLIRFATTRFRITAGQIELRRGIFGRSVLTAPLDRVRTVELTASPIHRLLALEKVEIGTGSANRGRDGRLVLDSLGSAEARRLRADLLHETHAEGTQPAPAASAPVSLMAFDPGWVRYAPLTTSGLVIALAALAASSQFLGTLIARTVNTSQVGHDVKALPLLVTVPAGIVTFLIVISILAIGGYLVANWGFTLTRDADEGSLHIRRGALTTRETSIDQDRLRGLEIHEPLGLRLAGGGRLTAIVTGVNRRSQGSTPMVPPAPRSVIIAVGERVLEENGPLYADLIQHGPAARRRRLVRGIVPLALVPAFLLLLELTASWPLWLVLATAPLPVIGLLLGLDRYRRLGHALTPSYVVMRWGSLRGRRDALQRTGIIGWNVRQTFFQRRAGLVSLTATTAAGRQSYEILDLPEDWAAGFADAAVPGLI